MPIDDFLSVTQPPPVGPEDLGVSPLGPAPQVPQAPQRKPQGVLEMIMRSLPVIAGAAMGPGAGTGLLRGTVDASDRQRAEQRQQQRDAMDQYRIEQQAYTQQAQQYEQTKRQREQILQQNLAALRNQVKDAPDKAAYDAYVEAFGNGLQGMGYRLDANWLRKAVPYVAPGVEKEALDLWTRWKDANQENFKADPSMAERSLVPFDRDGDGVPEQVSIADLGMIAGVIGRDSSGKPVTAKAGQVVATKTRKETILNQLVVKAKAEKKELTDELLADLNDEADRKVKSEELSEFKTRESYQEGLVRSRPEKTPPAATPATTPYASERAVRNLGAIDRLIPKVSRRTVGVGSLMQGVPESSARNFKAELDTLKANIAFGELTAMREASKTGGALGQVSERELALLESALGALDQGQSPQQFIQQLNLIKASIQRWQQAVAGQGAAPAGGDEEWIRDASGRLVKRGPR